MCYTGHKVERKGEKERRWGVVLFQLGWSRKASKEETWTETKRGQPQLKRGENLLDRAAIAMTRRQESRRHFCSIFWK